MAKKKVSIIGTNGVPANYGGFETLADFLCRKLNKDYDLIVYCSKTPKEKRLTSYEGARLVYLPFKANGWQSMVYDSISIIHSFFTCDVLIVLGFSGVFAFVGKLVFRKKIVFNIGGVEWKKVRGAKALGKIEVFVKKIFEQVSVYFSDVIIVDNKVLQDYVWERYKRESILAEYGGDHAIKIHPLKEHFEKYSFLHESYDVTVARAQEDMNIHLLIEAYKGVPNRKLVVISNWFTSDYGRSLYAKNNGACKNIILLHAIYDINELNVIRSNASLYIHAHSLCGTAPSLVEAMYIGLPVICFDVDTNRATTENSTYYFTDHLSLRNLLHEINSDKLKDIASILSEIAYRRYYWNRICGLYKNSID